MRALTQLCLLLSLTSHSPLAQAPTRLAGVWASPPELVGKSPLPPPGKTGTGAKGIARQTITQTADTITITGNGLTYKFALDGGKTVNCMRTPEGCVDNVCRASWEGRVFVTSCRVIWENGRETIITDRHWIDADGNLQVTVMHTTQGVTVHMRSTYVRQGVLLSDLLVRSAYAAGTRA